MKQRGGPQQGLEAEQKQRRLERLAKINAAFEAVQTAMHEAEGTVEGDYSTREMDIAGQHLDSAWMWAKEALEE